MKVNFKALWKGVRKFVTKNSNEILAGVGIGAATGAVIFAVADTPVAMQKIEEKKEELGVEKLTKIETVKATWSVYIPTAGMLMVAIGSIILNASGNAKKQKGLEALLAISEQTAREYRNAVKEEIGEKREQKIADKADRNSAVKAVASGLEPVRTGGGETLFYDSLSGALLYSSVNFLDSGINEFNAQLNTEESLPFRELQDYWNIKGGELSNLVGYSMRKPSGIGSGHAKIWYEWLTPEQLLPINDPVLIQTITNDSPMGVIHYRNAPSTDWDMY